MLATRLIEQLEARVNEFGDGEVVLPDPLEDWWYEVADIESDLGNRRYKLIPDV